MSIISCVYSALYFFANLGIFLNMWTSPYPTYISSQTWLVFAGSWIVTSLYIVSESAYIPYIGNAPSAYVLGTFVLMNSLFNHGAFVYYVQYNYYAM